MKTTVEEGNSYTTLTSYTIQGRVICVPDIVGWKYFFTLGTKSDEKTRMN